MSDNLEIVMDIDTLEIFEVIDQGDNDDVAEVSNTSKDSRADVALQEYDVQTQKVSDNSSIPERYVQLMVFNHHSLGKETPYLNDS